MSLEKAEIVQSLAGRDKGECFFVLAKDEKTVLLADGKHRTRERPKRKNLRHVKFLPENGAAAAAAMLSEQPNNAELRRAMAAYKAACEKRSMGGT
jgi:ribosomal protein L14E/L6E/L27E